MLYQSQLVLMFPCCDDPPCCCAISAPISRAAELSYSEKFDSPPGEAVVEHLPYGHISCEGAFQEHQMLRSLLPSSSIERDMEADISNLHFG